MTDKNHSPQWKIPTETGTFRNSFTDNASSLHVHNLSAHPSMYEVWLLNDDYTPMDFVVFMLEKLFHTPFEDARKLMMQVHDDGQASCGVYTREVAETKVMQVIDFARANEYPLKCIMRKSHEYVIKKS